MVNPSKENLILQDKNIAIFTFIVVRNIHKDIKVISVQEDEEEREV